MPRPMGSTYSNPLSNQIIEIDKSSLVRLEESLEHVRKGTYGAIWGRIRTTGKKIYKEFWARAPRSWRTERGMEDDRYDSPLYDSFDMWAYGLEARIRTTEPAKYMFTNEGTRPPTGGSGYIFPRQGKSILIAGPGPAAIVPWVGAPYTAQHPGTRAQHWAQRIIDESFGPGVKDSTGSIHWIGYDTADWFVDTLANLMNLAETRPNFGAASNILRGVM